MDIMYEARDGGAVMGTNGEQGEAGMARTSATGCGGGGGVRQQIEGSMSNYKCDECEVVALQASPTD